MTYQVFVEKIAQGVHAMLRESAQVTVCSTAKNNGVERKGRGIREKGSNISPAIYLEKEYERYQKKADLLQLQAEIAELYQRSRMENLDMDFFGHYEEVRGQITYRLISLEKNRELLKEVPYR